MEVLWLLGTGVLGLVLVVRDWRREQWVRALRRPGTALVPVAVPVSVETEGPTDAGE